MESSKKDINLKATEIYGMHFDSGYRNYYVFGTDPNEMAKRIIQMYNGYAGTKYNRHTFSMICKDNDYEFRLYKFDTTKQFSFTDECSIDNDGGIIIGEYFDLYIRKGKQYDSH